MKLFFMSLLVIGSLSLSNICQAQSEPCHDVRLTTDYLKTYGFQQKWVGTVPGHGSLFVFQDDDGHWSIYMVAVDEQTNTPVMCSISAGDKGLVTGK